jgi:1,2-diacylglycerol 3-alpha-glucosyltransferase
LTRAFANSADAVVVPTPAMAARLRDLGVTARIEIVPSGIDVARFAAGRRNEALRARLGVGSGDRLLLSVGRLAKEKNLESIVMALAKAQSDSLKLVVAGDGPSRQELERLARENGVADSARFLGAVERDDLPDLYASADAFLMPSTTETQGLVLAEALAAGVRVIAADTPQNRDVLGGLGVLVPADAGGFARAMVALEPGPYPGAGEARLSAQRFSLDAQIDRMLWLYESLTRPACIA